MSNGKVMTIRLIVGLIKKILLNEILLNKMLSNPSCKMSQYFPKPYDRFGRGVKVKLDSSNYATKADLKGANLATSTALTAVENKIPDVSNLVQKTDYDKNNRH